MTDTEVIRQMVVDFSSDLDGSYLTKNMTEGMVFVRPSGNPIAGKDYAAFIMGPDVDLTECKLVKIHKIEVGSDMAHAVITHSAKFTYKGTPNDDPSYIISLVFQKVDGAWRISYMQRSSSPSDTALWDSL